MENESAGTDHDPAGREGESAGMDRDTAGTDRDPAGHGPGEGASRGRGDSGKRAARPDEAGPIGVFPNWRWVYTTVVVYGVVVILALLVLTHVLDPGGTQ